jgi:hypothetical protein
MGFNLAFEGLKTETSLYVDGKATDNNQYMDHNQNIPPSKGTSFL